MRLPPTRPITDTRLIAAVRQIPNPRAQARAANNLGKLADLGVVFSLSIHNSLAGTDGMHPVLRTVLGEINLLNCRTAQAAVDMINMNLSRVLAKAEVRPGQKLPERFVLQAPPNDCQNLLEVELQGTK
jgi:hypothetical protein